MASGDTLCRLTPLGSFPPASNAATQDTRNSVPTLDFDASTEESAYWVDVLPGHYSGGGLTAVIVWAASSATSGDTKWGGSIEATGTDLDADSFATEQTATGTANGTSGIETETSITFTSGANMDSLAAHKRFRFKLARKAADGADTMTGDAELIAIEIKET